MPPLVPPRAARSHARLYGVQLHYFRVPTLDARPQRPRRSGPQPGGARILSTRRTCAPPARGTRATTSMSRRVITCWSNSSGTRGRSSSPRLSTRHTTSGRSGWPPHTRAGAAVDAGLSAQHLGRQSLQPLRHHPRGLARLERGIGGVGQHQSGAGQPRGGNAGVLPRTGQSQRRGAHPAAQVAARLRRRRHRGGHLLRSQRHPLPHDHRLR